MRILLPPSEAKRTGGEGLPLAEWGWGPRALSAHRRRLSKAVRALIRTDPDAAAVALRLPLSSRGDALAANRSLERSPTMAALDRYDGVLYRALDVGSLSTRDRRIAEESLIVFSGLFGAVGGAEAVPNYRVPAAAVLQGIGGVDRSWRLPLTKHLGAVLAGELVIDLRSTDYVAMWPPAPDVVSVRVLTEVSRGVRRAISFTGKQGKGLLARALVERPPRHLDDVIDAGRRLGCQPELRELGPGSGSGSGGGRTGLDLILVGREGFEPP